MPLENSSEVLRPDGTPDTDGSYRAYIDSLEPCPGCGRVDEMDNIEGQLVCAACFLDGNCDEDEDWWNEDEELRS